MRASKALREWWASPPRSGMRRVIFPVVYRHLRFFAAMEMAGCVVAVAIGVACLADSASGWAAFFLAVAALNLAGGWWYIAIARSESGRT